MCDKAEFAKLRDRVTNLEVGKCVHDEQIKTLFRGQRLQFWTVWGAFMLCLLTLIYGAIGSKGFNAVTNAAPVVTHNASVNE